MFVVLDRIKANVNKFPKMCDGLSIPTRQLITKQLRRIDDDIESLISDVGYIVLLEIDANYGIKCKEGGKINAKGNV